MELLRSELAEQREQNEYLLSEKDKQAHDLSNLEKKALELVMHVDRFELTPKGTATG